PIIANFQKGSQPSKALFNIKETRLLHLPPSPINAEEMESHRTAQSQRFVEPSIYIRATNMVYAHPLFGLGFDGFRRHCADAVYIYGMPPLNHFMAGMDPVVGCNIHPHNIYLEIATTAGLIGLMLFVCMVLIWLKKLLLAAVASKDLMLSMLFITLCMMFWPLASISSLFTERTAGWAFLMVGWGVALVKSANTQRA
ncbi:O-antigen ligase family protein, partial [Gluconobacter oxydans]|uniref:O-antigen ligase family protein n=1 Tax=Gluconobacter oxydans TaxID=442 RepID=UPI000A963C41